MGSEGGGQLGFATGGPHWVFGYVKGMAVPKYVNVSTWRPLLECAVPTMIEGVRP